MPGNKRRSFTQAFKEAAVARMEEAENITALAEELVDDPGRIRSLSTKARGWASVNA